MYELYLYILPPYLITIHAENSTFLLTIKKYVIQYIAIVCSVEIVRDITAPPLS